MNEYEFDPNNPEHLSERLLAIEAHNAGEPIEMEDWSGGWKMCSPQWAVNRRYRRATAPVVKWWSEPSHVPCPCWIQFGDVSELVTSVYADGISTMTTGYAWANLEKAKWALSHLGPFKPCTVPV